MVCCHVHKQLRIVGSYCGIAYCVEQLALFAHHLHVRREASGHSRCLVARTYVISVAGICAHAVATSTILQVAKHIDELLHEVGLVLMFQARRYWLQMLRPRQLLFLTVRRPHIATVGRPLGYLQLYSSWTDGGYVHWQGRYSLAEQVEQAVF